MTPTTILPNSAWVTRRRPTKKPQFRLFCLPYAGGSASIFRNWPSAIPSTIEICSLQLPGRENRLKELPYIQLMPLVKTLADMLYPYLDIPFGFFGHSMGALISFELARQIRRQYCLSPEHLFVSGRGAPQNPNSKAPIHHLPESEFIEELRAFNGTPEAVLQNSELMQLLMPVLRADFSVCDTYTYKEEPALDCPISAFGGLKDCDVGIEQLEAWHQQTRKSFKLRMFPGDHFFLLNNQESLLSELIRDLQRFSPKE
jgi:medium-chain acyl-[acyl-carrier-protein] hydrolase